MHHKSLDIKRADHDPGVQTSEIDERILGRGRNTPSSLTDGPVGVELLGEWSDLGCPACTGRYCPDSLAVFSSKISSREYPAGAAVHSRSPASELHLDLP